MKVLFVHQNFPAQYKHLAPALAASPDNEVVALCMNDQPQPPGVRVLKYGTTRGTTKDIHPWVMDLETKVIRGEACAKACLQLRNKGFVPDVICAHPGWGESLFIKDVFPEARLLDFLEFYYVSQGADYGFDLEYSETGWEGLARLRMKNANSILNLDSCDWAVSPTEWQASTVPEIYRNKITVVHDGIDTDFVRPDAGAAVRLEKAGVTLTAADEVITFVNRNMEPYRGFHIFMRALPEIQKRRPNAWVLVVGGDDVSYGRKLPPGQSYRKKYMAEVGHLLDMDRIRFVGRVPYADFLRMLQVSRAHVYLTYPFVLSWSMLEAMATGCLLIGSATPPVMEVIEDGVNGLLVDFFSPIGIADAIDRVLDHPDRMQALRNAARQTVIDRYDLKRVCLPRHIALVEGLAAGRIPPLGEAPPAPAAHGGRRTLEDVKRARMMAAMQPGGR